MQAIDILEMEQVSGGARPRLYGMYGMARAFAKAEIQEKTKLEGFLQGKVFTPEEIILASFKPY